MIHSPSTPATAVVSSLLPQAIAALNAANTTPADQSVLVEERNVWQPGSWLIQRCWEILADLGAGEEALAIARLTQRRQPLAPLQALHRIARQADRRPLLALLVARELQQLQAALFYPSTTLTAAQSTERLLLAAATAAAVDQLPLACACLERLDQQPSPWTLVFTRSDLRTLLVESAAGIGLQPLITSLVTGAVRRFDDAGAHFLHDTAALVAQQGEAAPRRGSRLFQRCIQTFEYATLTTLLGRRLAAITLARAGLVDDVLAQLTVIANVQDARREAGITALREEAQLVRQVKRPAANADIDFQVYTLQQAVAAMPIRRLPREKRILLADQLAFLGVRSDGWTAAGAAATLIELGALKYAVEVVEHIAPGDPTRAEGMLALVRGLLAVAEPALAAEQAGRALAWARSRPDRNPERAIIWGLAGIYLDHAMPTQALHWLAQWREPTGWQQRWGSLWRKPLDDDGLRLRSLRWRALLQQGTPGGDSPAVGTYQRELQQLWEELITWTPRLLDGEALVHSYLDWLLRPLLAADKRAQAWSLLPKLVEALSHTSGSKHTAAVAATTTLLAQQWRSVAPHTPATSGNGTVGADPDLRQTLERFLTDLWRADARRGAWQIVHGLEGSLPLLLALEGPEVLVALARSVQQQGSLWEQ
jgi:hypothetical protein